MHSKRKQKSKSTSNSSARHNRNGGDECQKKPKYAIKIDKSTNYLAIRRDWYWRSVWVGAVADSN